MHDHDQEPLRTDVRLTMDEQRAVLMLANRLQQEYDEGATLADLILIGQEAGLSREAVEEAYRRIKSQPNERAEREQMGRSLSRELAAVHFSVVWALLIWAGVMFLPTREVYAQIGVGGTFFVFPIIIGILSRRVWVAAALVISVSLSMMIAFTVRFGLPQEAGARQDMVIFLVPVAFAVLVSGLNGFLAKTRHKAISSPNTRGV